MLDLEKADAEAAKKRLIKPKDPENTAKVREELDLEGQSIIEEKKINLNSDKVSGSGTLKVRFQVTNDRRSYSEKK